MAEKKTLSFDKGLVEYDINGDCTLVFNPTDMNLAQSLFDLMDELKALQNELKAINDKEDLDKNEKLEAFRGFDEIMRGKIDAVLGDGVSKKLFGDKMNCYAFSNGWPLWCNFVVALLDEMSEAFEREFGKTDSRTKAHQRKYDAMMAKYRKR